ncbi:MAG: maleylpyruvate isomerase family mycothiol-dependent enzyme, partial [Brachybacterium paraconglomeratum]|nr:maleylpyruvate isomerase family mycothiol-dependent enzyme [Brachybacterium paraconglomeratum]
MSVQQTAAAPARKQARRSPFDRETAARLAGAEYARVADLLATLTTEQWAADSGCPGWDVRAMAGHMLGMTQMAASRRELVGQLVKTLLRVRRDGGLLIDALTAHQVAKNARLSTGELVAEWRRLTPRAVHFRTRLPRLLRGRAMKDEQFGWWTFGYLMDVITTRDPFMHRIDISRATGRDMVATADHEGVLVDDVVHEWADRHGMPFVLDLSGPAGGHWQVGEDGVHLTMDAFDFCRVLSGRERGEG